MPFLFPTFPVNLAYVSHSTRPLARSAPTFKPTPGVISGVFYADYYAALTNHDKSIQGKDGFWFRRINLNYRQNLQPNVAIQLRMEAKDPGDFGATSSTLNPYVKDAWVNFTATHQTITFGLIPTPTFDHTEGILNYRGIERTPVDLYNMGMSRDKGISVQGPIGKASQYWIMLGDGSGLKSSSGNSRNIYLLLTHQFTPTLSAEIYGDAWKLADGSTRQTYSGNAYFKAKNWTVGLLYATLRRNPMGASASSLNVASIYAETSIGPRWRPFARLDLLSDAVPASERIGFFDISTAGRPTYTSFGVRYLVAPGVEFIPSLHIWHYSGIGGAPAPGQDQFLRLTVSVKF